MTKAEPNPRCPRCAGRPKTALSAPALNRGAQPSTSVPVPQSRSKREDLAVRLALEDTGHSDINTNQRAGDSAVKPIDMGVPKQAPAELQTGFRSLDTDPKARGQQIAAMGASMTPGERRRNFGLLGKMKG
jgi:hypothetical protein